MINKIKTKNYYKLRREKEITLTIQKLRTIIVGKNNEQIILSLEHQHKIVKLKSWMEEIKTQLESIKLKLKLKLETKDLN